MLYFERGSEGKKSYKNKNSYRASRGGKENVYNNSQRDITTAQWCVANDSEPERALLFLSTPTARGLTLSACEGFPHRSLQGSESLPACFASAHREAA